MDRMTERQTTVDDAIAEFYDKLAPDYDAMTGFEQRFVKERPFFKLLVERHGIHTALDTGCGTGFHSLLLARLGVHVTALDISPNMLAIAERHAKEMQLPIRFVEGPFHAIPSIAPGPYDAVFSLGNSLAHLLTKDDLALSLAAFATVLSSHGVLFLQNLNYDRIMEKKELIQSVKEDKEATFIRSYEYADELIHFNVLKAIHERASVVQDINTVALCPLLHKELVGLLADAGFDEIKSFGGIAMDAFRIHHSRDLVVLARKKG